MLRERVAANQVYLVAWPIGWLSPLSDPPRGRPQILGGARRQGQMTARVPLQTNGQQTEWCATLPTNCSEPLALYFYIFATISPGDFLGDG